MLRNLLVAIIMFFMAVYCFSVVAGGVEELKSNSPSDARAMTLLDFVPWVISLSIMVISLHYLLLVLKELNELTIDLRSPEEKFADRLTPINPHANLPSTMYKPAGG